MTNLENIVFDASMCTKELQDYKELLASKDELSERKDILPFFRARPNLSAFIGSYAFRNTQFDKIAFELKLFSDFVCDMVCGDSITNTYCLVEFEDAKMNSIFTKLNSKKTPEWSTRFTHGTSQIVDWYWKLHEMQDHLEMERLFGSRNPNFLGVLVCGRDQRLEPREVARLKWYRNRLIVDSQKICAVTFDELYKDLESRLKIMFMLSSSLK